MLYVVLSVAPRTVLLYFNSRAILIGYIDIVRAAMEGIIKVSIATGYICVVRSPLLAIASR